MIICHRFATLIYRIVVIVFVGSSINLQGQDFGENRSRFQLRADRTVDQIEIDGVLDEQTWAKADIAKDFFRVLPIDSGQATSQTEVLMAFNDTEFFMAIICHDTVQGKRPAESLRRDFSFGKNDNFLAFIDTYNDQTNGFSFGISASGAQWDGLQADGGFVSLDWDCKWRSAIVNDDDKWVAEFAIPFRSIRYRDGVHEWGINFSRLDLKTGEKSSWAPVPRQFQTANLAYTGTVIFSEPPPKLGTRFSLIPYVSGRSTRNALTGINASDADVGLDAKVTLSTSLNLDVTINPDYSQVEVDRQVTNLDRFELFFPERRQFFLENSDLFASLGSSNIRPFFSRRIGLDAPVQAGVRLSGKAGEKTRIGLMNIQTGNSEDIPAANFTVAAIQRRVFSRSNIGAFIVNKDLTSSFDATQSSKFNRIIGLDYNLASSDNKWTGKSFFHQAFFPGASGQAFAAAGSLKYETQRFSASLSQEYVGRNYQAEVGFIRRKGYYWLRPAIEYRFLPPASLIASHGPMAFANVFYDSDLNLTDRRVSLLYEFQLTDRSSFGLDLDHTYIKLSDPFDPTNTGGEMLPANDDFNWVNVGVYYNSNTRSLFNYNLLFQYGNYFNGNRFVADVMANYRVQPYGSIGLVAVYNGIRLPQPYNDANLFLLGPKLDITFTKKLFLTTFFQFNNQIENVNLNVRFQWRYAPVSDFFLVYTSNAYSNTLQNKNRAIVAKVSYYFN